MSISAEVKRFLRTVSANRELLNAGCNNITTLLPPSFHLVLFISIHLIARLVFDLVDLFFSFFFFFQKQERHQKEFRRLEREMCSFLQGIIIHQ